MFYLFTCFHRMNPLWLPLHTHIVTQTHRGAASPCLITRSESSQEKHRHEASHLGGGQKLGSSAAAFRVPALAAVGRTLAILLGTEKTDIRFQFEFHFHEKNIQSNPLVLPKARKGPCSREVPLSSQNKFPLLWRKREDQEQEKHQAVGNQPCAVCDSSLSAQGLAEEGAEQRFRHRNGSLHILTASIS